MKQFCVLVTFIVILSQQAFAACTVISDDSELTSGVNKETICRDTLVAVTGSYADHEDYTVSIVTSDRGMYYVKLSQIVVSHPKMETLVTSGTLNWYPGDSYVDLD